MKKDKKLKDKKMDGTQHLYVVKTLLDNILSENPELPQEVRQAIVSARDVAWNVFRSEEEKAMPSFEKEGI